MFLKRRWVAGSILTIAAIGTAVAGTALASAPGNDPAQVTPPVKVNVYSAPFTCGLVPSGGVPLDPTQPQQGLPRELPLKPANYATDINVHNPGRTEAPLAKKAVLTGWVAGAAAGATGAQTSEPEQVFPGGAYHQLVLPPDGAFEVDCNDIAKVLQPPGMPNAASFIKGFVVIETRATLDVQDVITTERVGTTVVQCLLSTGAVVTATPDAANVLSCPQAAAGAAGTIGITSSNTGTGLSIEVTTILPDVVSKPAGTTSDG